MRSKVSHPPAELLSAVVEMAESFGVTHAARTLQVSPITLNKMVSGRAMCPSVVAKLSWRLSRMGRETPWIAGDPWMGPTEPAPASLPAVAPAPEHQPSFTPRKKRRNKPRVPRSPEERAAARERKYGLTPVAFAQLLVEQGGVCAICSEKQPESLGDLFVDHCHVTGRVRGLLCMKCNAAIGLLRDSQALAESASAYLRKHEAKP